jgi:hypothetical protein
MSRLRGLFKKYSALLIKPFGIRLLSKEDTINYLAHYELIYSVGQTLLLKSVPNLLLDSQPLFGEKLVTTSSIRVWRYERLSTQVLQLPNGSLMINKCVLDTDFGNGIVVKDWLKYHKRTELTATILIAPWSHYWTGYYDYLFFVALKLCRIKNTLSATEFRKAVVCYPLTYTSYEQDILALFGFEPERILDSRHVNVQFQTCILGSNDSWFYANEQDIYAFKQLLSLHLAKHVPIEVRQRNRIYVRRAGRRKILNEEALLALLQQYSFQVIDDVPHTLLEQVHIYYHAAFIIGPHGAAFANILWCQPDTHLFELFPNTYTPDYFRYLAQVMGLTYSAYCHGAPVGSDHRHVEDNIYIDIQEVKRCLSVAFEG